MADEFRTLLREFSALGRNYCANARQVITDLEMRKMVDIYEAGLTRAMSGLTELLNARYDALPDDQKGALDRTVTISGGLEMLGKANETIGRGSIFNPTALAAGAALFPKIKDLIRRLVDIEEGGLIDKLLGWIDKIVENIPKLMGVIGR